VQLPPALYRHYQERRYQRRLAIAVHRHPEVSRRRPSILRHAIA